MSRFYKGASYDQITEHHIHIENEADDKDKSQEWKIVGRGQCI
jgi:hypothetical protein